jgi:hypothetical protein
MRQHAYFGWIPVLFCAAALLYGEEPARVLEPVPVEVQRAHTTTWITYRTVTMNQLAGFHPLEVSLGKFGGRTDRREEATGFFHAKKVEGRWILVDPEGYHFFSAGVNCVDPSDTSPDSLYAFQVKFGSRQKWVEGTHDLFQKLGFNTLGNWSAGSLFKEGGRPMPYTVSMSIIGSYARKKNLYMPSYGSTNLKGDVLPVFNEDLPAHIDEACRKLAETKDNPWVFGIFSDNEIPLFEEDIIRRYLAMGEDDPGAKRARAWLAEHGKTEEMITAADDREFCLLVLSKYFGMVRDAIKKYDPNHMYFGTRFHKTVLTQPSAYEAAGPYMDVIAINLYHRWNIDQEMISRMAETAGKPMMITEWYAKGVDSGLRNESGAGFTVHTQKDRGMFYENLTISLLRNPNMVGWHWFRYMDEGPFQKGEKASNKGLLNCHFEPYEGLADSMARINRNVYGLRDYLLNLRSPNLPDKPTVYNDSR